MRHEGETLITDFRPALVEGGGAGVVPYRLDGREGDETALRLASPVKGWHRVYIL